MSVLVGRAALLALGCAALALSACAVGHPKPPTNLTQTSVTLNGSVYSNVEGNTDYWFVYGPTTAYESQTPGRTIFIDSEEPRPVSEPVSGLTPDTTYHWRLCVEDDGEDPPRTICSSDQQFTTGGSLGAGPGGPILVVGSASDPFSRYYAEILRAEGLNEFAVSDGPVTSGMLAGKEVAILGSRPLSDAEVTLLSNWVQGGGNLIAMRPDKKLASLLGVADAGGTRTDQFMRVDTGTPAGAGIDDQTLQFHGTADRYSLAGAGLVARLYSNSSTSTSDPAVTLRSVGTSGGQAAAFTYDLARSVVYTRQGNPAWAGQKRDTTPIAIRPDDLFYGAKPGDVQPDWVDPDRRAVPQADEQQRLLANLVTTMALDRVPLPRFWYLPRGEKAAVVMTGDDHAVGGTPAYFNRFKSSSPAGCSVPDWDCVRATSYVYPNTPMTNAQADAFEAEGFEIALHLNTGCADFTPPSLDTALTTQLDDFAAAFPSVHAPVSNRTHCVAWSDWATQPKLERVHGIRLDANYYYLGPPGWLTEPGLLTGSGFPQRFADLDGRMLDVYQATTQVTDESNLAVAWQTDTLLDNALGPKAYYGVFTVNMHSDFGDQVNANNVVASAQERGVPVVSSAQMLDWLDGRNASSFGDVSFAAGRLDFSITADARARGLEAMLPAAAASGPLSDLRRNGQRVTRSTRTVKGVSYVVFKAAAGDYVATYAADSSPPAISGLSVSADQEGHAQVRWDTDEPGTSRVRYGRTTALGSEIFDAARVNSHAVELTGLSPGATYFFRASSADAAGNNADSPSSGNPPSSFQTTPGALVDSRTTEFSAGTESAVHVGGTLAGSDGEVQLLPAVGEEFEGAALPPGWSSSSWGTGGEASVAGGALAVDGSAAFTTPFVGPPRTLEFAATFEPVNGQAVGLGDDFTDFPGAAFITGSAGDPIRMYAWSGASPSTETLTPLPGVSLQHPHRFRIEWGTTSVAFFVDGAQVAVHGTTINGPMRPAASDVAPFGAGVRVHWMRQGGYSAAGTLTSRPLDSGIGAAQWGTLVAVRTLPGGTQLLFDTRSGSTPTPDGSWSAWQPTGAGGAVASPTARYVQYRARLSGTGAATPTLQRVAISFGT